jgi:methylglyoxal reductase
VRRRLLGRSGIEVSVIAAGGMTFGEHHGDSDENRLRALDAAFERGVNAIDTAPLYGFGRSERLVGRAIRGRRDRIVVMSKVGLRWDDPRGEILFEHMDARGHKLPVRRNSRPDSVRLEVERSLERLGVDAIDVVQVHHRDRSTPIADTMGTLLDLRSAGKLRAIGVSNYSVDEIEEAARALGDVPLASDQPEYNLLHRDAERDVLPYAAKNGIGIVVYSPLAQGLLSGRASANRRYRLDDWRWMLAGFRPENRRLINAALRRAVEPIARAHGWTTGQAVLGWTLAQPGVTSAIVGLRSPAQAEENTAAGDAVLSAGELASIRAAFEALELDPRPVPWSRRTKLRYLWRKVLAS